MPGCDYRDCQTFNREVLDASQLWDADDLTSVSEWS